MAAVAGTEQALAHPLAKCSWCESPFVRGRVKDAEVWLCPREACWSRQVKHALVVTLKGQGTRCLYVPLPRQVEFLESDARRVLFGGAAGGSKSHALRWLAYLRCLSVPQFKALILRRTSPELKKTHLREAEIEAPTFGAIPLISDNNKMVRFPNGSILEFGHCDEDKAVTNYLSAEYDLILFDELVTFTEQQFLMISSRARTKKDLTPRVLAGTNPGGPNAYWVRSRFIDKTVDLQAFPNYRPEEHAYIPSRLEDNPYLNEDYEQSLLDLPEELRRAYREGDWDIFPGQYFPEFRKATHVTAEHIEYPADLPRSLSMDWGFVKPGVVGWWVQVDGHAYREEEYVFSRTTAFDVGKEVARRCKARGLTRLQYLVYDTAMEIPQNDTGESTIETVRRGLRAGGVSIATVKADKDRINGWQRLRHWFRLAPDGKPWMQASPLCTYFARTIPSLVSDEHKPEDVDTDGEDHAGDDARYWAMSRPLPGAVVHKEKPKAMSLGWFKQQAASQARGILAR